MQRLLPLATTAILATGVAVITFTAAFASPGRTAGHRTGSAPKVIATGLDNPRGLAIGPDGALYVTEAGRGGDAPCVPGPVGPACYGPSGAITRLGHGGRQQRIVTGLSSFALPDGRLAFGPHDIAFSPPGRAQDRHRSRGRHSARHRRATAYVVVGPCAMPDATCDRLLKLTGHGGWRTVADLNAFERKHNPDGLTLESNPYGVLALRGERIVANAASNDLLRVSPGGRVSVLAVFPQRTVSGPGGTPLRMDAVPTSVAAGPDGALYVAQLTGEPFPVGAARIYRLVPGGVPEVYVDGFTNVIDIAFARDGSLLVLEMAKNSLASGDPGGALIRLAPDGSRKTLLKDGLVSPAAVAIGRHGWIYVTNHGQEPGVGEVLRFRPAHHGRR